MNAETAEAPLTSKTELLTPVHHPLYGHCLLLATDGRPLVIRQAADGCWQPVRQRSGQTSPGRQTLRGGRKRNIACLLYEELVGPIPPNARLKPSCENPDCCRPEHLRLTTIAELTGGLAKPGVRGEANGRAKLSADQAREIFASEETVSELARRFGVDRKLVRAIRQGKVWQVATGAPLPTSRLPRRYRE